MSERERENAEIAYQTAAAGMVLLENNGVLPLKEKGKLHCSEQEQCGRCVAGPAQEILLMED